MGYSIDLAISGDKRDRSRRFGKGRIGLSGYIGEVISDRCPVGERGGYIDPAYVK